MNYIFDFDGTLIDDSEDIINSIKSACRKEGINITDTTQITIGKPIEAMLNDILNNIDPDTIKKIKNNYRQIYDNIENSSVQTFKGSYELLNTLKIKNNKIFLLTNKPQKPTKKLINQLRWNSFFNKIYTIDSFPSIKNKKDILKRIISDNNISTENTVYIGDSLEDIDAAKTNNIISIAAMWGYETNKNLLKFNADFYLEQINVENLDLLIKQIVKYLVKAHN